MSTKVEQFKLPNWLKEKNHAYIKNHRRTHKADPLVCKVLIRRILSSHNAEVLFIDSGRISTVSTRHLSRAPTEITVKPVETFNAVDHATPHSAGKLPAPEPTIEIKHEPEDPVLETKIENISTENTSLGAINDDILSVLNNCDEPIHNTSLQEKASADNLTLNNYNQDEKTPENQQEINETSLSTMPTRSKKKPNMFRNWVYG